MLWLNLFAATDAASKASAAASGRKDWLGLFWIVDVATGLSMYACMVEFCCWISAGPAWDAIPPLIMLQPLPPPPTLSDKADDTKGGVFMVILEVK